MYQYIGGQVDLATPVPRREIHRSAIAAPDNVRRCQKRCVFSFRLKVLGDRLLTHTAGVPYCGKHNSAVSQSINQLVYLYGSSKAGLKHAYDENYNAITQLH